MRCVLQAGQTPRPLHERDQEVVAAVTAAELLGLRACLPADIHARGKRALNKVGHPHAQPGRNRNHRQHPRDDMAALVPVTARARL